MAWRCLLFVGEGPEEDNCFVEESKTKAEENGDHEEENFYRR